MKKNRLIRASFTPVTGGKIHENLAKSFLIRKDEKDTFLMQYPSPRHLCDFELLAWNELDNCNFFEKIIYKINIPKWLGWLIERAIIILMTALATYYFSNSVS